MKLLHATTGMLACAIGLCIAGKAHAGTEPTIRQERTNAAGICQGALPQFAGTLRARPMAIANEGASIAFVTCSIDSGVGVVSKAIKSVTVSVFNNSGALAQVTCTLVAGYGGVATYYPRTHNMTPGSGVEISWQAGEQATQTYIAQPNLSCSLPPGTLIYYVAHEYTDPPADS